MVPGFYSSNSDDPQWSMNIQSHGVGITPTSPTFRDGAQYDQVSE